MALLGPLEAQKGHCFAKKGHSRGIRGHLEISGATKKILQGAMVKGHPLERATGKLSGPLREFCSEPWKEATECKGPLGNFRGHREIFAGNHGNGPQNGKGHWETFGATERSLQGAMERGR